MKAAICTQYGESDAIEVQDMPKPTPKKGEVLIKVMASSCTAADNMMRQGKPYFGRLFLGLTKPKHPITGTGFAGVIEELGEQVELFKVHDEVFGESVFGAGSNAEYLCVPQDALMLHKPNNISFEEAAPICDGALTSLNFLKDVANLQVGQRILINGASGSLGCAAVQLAKYYGAHVTGVCSTKNIDLVKSLGADEVIDYTQQNFESITDHFHVIYDTVGKRSFKACQAALKDQGQFISPVLSLGLLMQVLKTGLFSALNKGKKAKFSATGIRPPKELRPLLQELLSVIDQGAFTTNIDKRFALDDIQAAHEYVATGHKIGNIVIIPS